jgi:uncharacterized membrane protein
VISPAVRGESGQTTVLVVGLALVCFGVVGVAVDGTRAFLFRRSLQNIADSAALAGASEVSRTLYYGSGGKRITVDARKARAAAASLLTRRGIDTRAAIGVSEAGVEVTLKGELGTTFLGVVGVEALPVSVQARSEPLEGSPGP